MEPYQQALSEMQRLFGKDRQFVLATAKDNAPSSRYIDAYYEDGSFYAVTYGESRKAREITENPAVALCNRTSRFLGAAHSIGHPLDAGNGAIRERLRGVFADWYDRHNDESDPNMRYVRIDVTSGFFHADGTGYEVDFSAKTAKVFPFAPDVCFLD